MNFVGKWISSDP